MTNDTSQVKNDPSVFKEIPLTPSGDDWTNEKDRNEIEVKEEKSIFYFCKAKILPVTSQPTRDQQQQITDLNEKPQLQVSLI